MNEEKLREQYILVPWRTQRVIMDVDTQNDLHLVIGNVMGKKMIGKACIRDHSEVLANIRRIMAWARRDYIPIISTALVFRNNSAGYCVDGSPGQKKLSYTLLSNRVTFAADGNTDLDRDLMRKYRQVVMHKRCMDPFDEPCIDRLLTEVRGLHSELEFILIGSIAEAAVKLTALGLLQRGKKVKLVADAVGHHNQKDARLAIRKMHEKGAKLVTTKSLAGESTLRGVNTCKCASCKPQRLISVPRYQLAEVA